MIKYIYESHLGGLYTTDEEQSYGSLYCDECGDSDSFVGKIDSDNVSIWDFMNLVWDSKDVETDVKTFISMYIDMGIDAELVKAFRDLVDDCRRENGENLGILDTSDPGAYYNKCILKQREMEVISRGNRAYCPRCEHWLATISDVDDWGILCADGRVYDYCPYCGQKLGWDGEKIGEEVDRYAKTKRTEVD